jgi:hypothetical protein
MASRSNNSKVKGVWLVAIPINQEFSQPQFHFGERVKWWVETKSTRNWLTGRIKGMWFTEKYEWEYWVEVDPKSVDGLELEDSTTLRESALKFVKDANSTREFLQPISEWQPTHLAATFLGLSPDQLRNLRLRGVFVEGQHYRDTSLPNSARPCWQWHVERCNQQLAKKRKSVKDG